MDEHATHAEHPNYMAIFGYLVVLTLASFMTVPLRGTLAQSPWLIVLFVFAVAMCKATLVAMFFMHLKFEGRWKYVLVFPPLMMGIVLVLALLPDIAIGTY